MDTRGHVVDGEIAHRRGSVRLGSKLEWVGTASSTRAARGAPGGLPLR